MAANRIDSHLEKLSYVPYSEKPRYCVLKSREGSWFPGVRIENISYPLTINCVQAAVVHCLSEGHQPETLYYDRAWNSLEYWIEHLELEVRPFSELPITSADLYSPVRKDKMDTPKPSQLEELAKKALVDQSNFPVAALLKVEDGFISGVNLEFDDWQMGLCAERTALAKAIAAGYNNFQELDLYAPKGTFISPCGACRQVLVEHLPDTQLSVIHADGTQSRHFIKHLLPFNFHSDEL